MPNYDFLNLSPLDFEDLSRDLIQKKEGIILETFTAGRDGGMDGRLRYSNTNQLIVQSKRYSKFSNLISNLKKEVKKLKKLNPKRYILTTTVGLGPKQKNQIFKLFDGFIKEENDIIHRDDLNNLLGIFPEIEKQHFKLWLTSSSVLQKLVNGDIETQTTFEREEIEKNIKLYVRNDSFFEAISILDKFNFVIISGIPGIGKTTLARMLLFYLPGFEENSRFVFLSRDISEGLKEFENCNLFFFDDFLGRNLLRALSGNEEKRIVQFIKKVKGSKNKKLIITTRDYILNKGKTKFEDFNDSLLDIGKCVLDLSKYTPFIKAKILYNHIYFSSIPNQYKKALIEEENYLKIIKHQNYNPRIIEQVLNKEKIWKQFEPDNFIESFLKFLDNPFLIWKHIFEQQLSELSKNILLQMLLTEEELTDNQVFDSVSGYLTSRSKIQQKIEFENSLKELEGTFIKIDNSSFGDNYLKFQNPSIVDYLLNYVKNNPIIIPQLINDITHMPQLLQSFLYDVHIEEGNDWRIPLDPNNRKIWTKKVIELSEDWTSGSNEDKMLCLMILYNHVLIDSHPKIRKFIKKAIRKVDTSKKIPYDGYYLRIMFDLTTYYNMNWGKISKVFFKKIKKFDELTEFANCINHIFSENHEDYLIYDILGNEFVQKHGIKFISKAQVIIEKELSFLEKLYTRNQTIIQEDKKYIEKKFKEIDMLFYPRENYSERIDELFKNISVIDFPEDEFVHEEKAEDNEITPHIQEKIIDLFNDGSLLEN